MRFSSQKSPLPEDAREGVLSRFTRRHRILAGAAALAVALLSGGVMAVTTAAAPAQAHNGTATADCYKIVADYKNYDGSKANTMTISYTETTGTVAAYSQTFGFGNALKKTITFPDSSKKYNWTVEVKAGDNDPRWHFTTTGKTDGCVVPTTPTISASAETCTVTSPNATIPLKVELGNLTAGRSYTVSAPGLTPQTIKADTATASATFPSAKAGGTYTFTVVDTQDGSLKATTKPVTVQACPTVGTITVSAEQCTAPGQSAAITIASDAFVPGKQYVVTTSLNTSNSYTATAGKTLVVQVLPKGTADQEVTVTVAFGTNADSTASAKVTLKPCPSGTLDIAITAAPCTIGDTTRATTATITGLVPGRSYDVTLDGKKVGGTIEATGTSAVVTKGLEKVSFGSHTLTVTDTESSASAATKAFVSETCASTPKITTHLDPCTVPDGSGTITATVAGLTAGRSYTVTITDDGEPVDGQPTQSFVADAATKNLSFTGLTKGGEYTIVVTDSLESRATATADVTVADCPPQPEVGGVSIACVAGASPSIVVTLSDLTPGQQSWRIDLDHQNADGSYTNVSSRSVATVNASDLTFANVVNGDTYRVTLTSTPSNIVVSEVVPVNCGTTTPPTTPNTPTTPGEVGGVTIEALATTGADVALPLAAGVSLVSLGALLTVLTVLRRRKEARG